MAVRAGFGVDKEAVKQSEAQRQEPVVRGDVLRCSPQQARRFSCAENRQARVTIGPRTIAGSF